MADHEIVDILGGEIVPGVEGWSVVTRRPDGNLWQTVFPKCTLEWRAAEYGLTDPAEILDVILHESAVPAPDTTPTMRSLAKSSSARASTPPPVGALGLYAATSTRAARTSHLSLVAEAKKTRAITDPNSLLQHILNDHGMDPDRVRARAELVDIQRWSTLYGALPEPDPTSPLSPPPSPQEADRA